jgi:hypothetical protein
MKKILIVATMMLTFGSLFGQNVSTILSNTEILTKMYPSARIANNEAEWSGLDLSSEPEDKLLRSSIKYKEFYIENQTLKCLILTQTTFENNDCHSCLALLGGCVLKKVDDTWAVEILSKEIEWMGYWGQISGSIEGVRLSESSRGVLIKDSYMNQGITASMFHVLGILNGTMQFLSDGIEAEADNNGGCDPESETENNCYSYGSTAHFSLGINHAKYFLINKKESAMLFDFVIETSGTKVDETTEQISEYNRLITYQFKNDKYIKVSDVPIE